MRNFCIVILLTFLLTITINFAYGSWLDLGVDLGLGSSFVATDGLLLEDGGNLILEDNSGNLLLE